MAPFAGCQWYAYTSYCRANIPGEDNHPIFNNDLPEEVITYGKANNLLMPFISINDSVAAEWCQAEPPISYHHVIAKYWKIDVFKVENLFYSFTNSSTQWPYLIIACPVYGRIWYWNIEILLVNSLNCNRYAFFHSLKQLNLYYSSVSLAIPTFRKRTFSLLLSSWLDWQYVTGIGQTKATKIGFWIPNLTKRMLSIYDSFLWYRISWYNVCSHPGK